MSNRSIRESLNKLCGTDKLDTVFYVNATVESVNINARTCDCTVIDGKAEYDLPNVRLMAVVDDGLLIEPVVGSTVKVIFSQNVEPYVCQFSEIQNITIISVGQITLNDGSFGGLIKISDLVSKMNILEKDLNALKEAFTGWIVAPTDGGAALKAITATWSGSQITETQNDDLENTKVTHGI
jgi:hypothetical protein